MTKQLIIFVLSILTYTLLSVASQYGSATTLELFAGLFIPISAFTIIPLLDCSRSFSQGCAERANVPFKVSFSLLVIVPLIIAYLCTIFANLPISIFWGALFATGIGGFMDVITFKFMGRFTDNDVKRMSVSNAAATIIGSAIFFLIAFTPLLPTVFGIENVLSKGDYINPLISSQIQAAVIYTCGMMMAWGTFLLSKARKAIV